MKSNRIAVPSDRPGDLDGARSAHFGNCGWFTIIDLIGGDVIHIEGLQNTAHAKGGCMTPVKILQNRQVDSIIVGGMGRQPLTGFRKAGIAVYWAPLTTYPVVRDALAALLNKKLLPMSADKACQGTDNCLG